MLSSLKLCPVLCAFRQSKLKVPMTSYFNDKQNRLVIENVCSLSFICECSSYSALLGVLGTGLSLFDIIRVINCGACLPCSLWRSRIEPGKLVSVTCERDLKLISLVLSLEYYLLLLIGSVTQNALFFIPWLFLYGIIILSEFAVFFCRLLTEGFKISKHGLALTVFITYNWLTIFCNFYGLMKLM